MTFLFDGWPMPPPPPCPDCTPPGPIEGFIAFMLAWLLIVSGLLLALPRSWTALAFPPRSAIGDRVMSQCHSQVFFPDAPGAAPQFSPCPREAVTTRRTPRTLDKNGAPRVVSVTVRLCAICAREWDGRNDGRKVKR